MQQQNLTVKPLSVILPGQKTRYYINFKQALENLNLVDAVYFCTQVSEGHVVGKKWMEQQHFIDPSKPETLTVEINNLSEGLRVNYYFAREDRSMIQLESWKTIAIDHHCFQPVRGLDTRSYFKKGARYINVWISGNAPDYLNIGHQYKEFALNENTGVLPFYLIPDLVILKFMFLDKNKGHYGREDEFFFEKTASDLDRVEVPVPALEKE